MVPLVPKNAMEEAIRLEADPKGLYSRDLIDTAGLVKNIRKRHRDAIEEHRKDKDVMRIEKENLQHRFDDEKERLCGIIRGQNEALKSRNEQRQQICDNNCELQFKHQDLLDDNKAKDSRIIELKEKVEATIETCNRVTQGSVVSLKIADKQMEHRITRIKIKHQEELAEIRGWNSTLQERMKIARRLQPVIVLHRDQVGTVCKLHESLVQMKIAKTEELAAKENENEELRARNDRQEREIRDLKIVAKADGKVLEKTDKLLSDTRKALSEAKGKIENHQREVTTLNQWGKVWEKGYRSKDKEYTKLESEMNTLRANQRMELIRAEAKNEGLQTRVDSLQIAKDRMDKDLECWENGHGGSPRSSKPYHKDKQPGEDAESLAKGLKAENARADALQNSVNALQAEKDVLERQLGIAANAYNPQIQEQVKRLQSENQRLGKTAEEAALLKIELEAEFAAAEKEREDRLTNRTKELELGFENFDKLRDQWLLRKRGLEEEHDREILAENLRCQIERQKLEAQLKAVSEEKEKEILREKEDLQSQKAELATQVRNLHSDGQNLVKMKARAHKAEKEVLELQVAEANNRNHRDSIQRNLENELQSQRRDAQRHLDLLNEEIYTMAEDPRLLDLHNELQRANCSMNIFDYNVTYVGLNSEALGQNMFGADFCDSDVRLLQDAGRPVLLAQLQAAKRTLNELGRLLAENPEVDMDKALSLVRAPRGDEDAAQPVDDIFDLWNETEQPAPQSDPRKRSGAPLGHPTYGDHQDNPAFDDWGVQDHEVSMGARLSTPEDISNRHKILPKSRLNGGPTFVPLENIDPAIRDQ